jgi:peptide deformylase
MPKQLRIYTIEDKREEASLRKKSSLVTEEELKSQDFQEFLKDLLHTAKNSVDQVGMTSDGIAAPQVGENKRAFYILNDDTNSWQLYINPEVKPLNFSKISLREGCLSVPNREGEVLRYKKVEVKYQNKEGEWKKKKLSDYNAIVIQHELDHLDGILFIDRIE